MGRVDATDVPELLDLHQRNPHLVTLKAKPRPANAVGAQANESVCGAGERQRQRCEAVHQPGCRERTPWRCRGSKVGPGTPNVVPAATCAARRQGRCRVLAGGFVQEPPVLQASG